MIARVGNDPCPLRLRNEWLSPCAASTLPSVGLEICASCATRGTCIRTHLFPTPCREAAITTFDDHPNASITCCIAGCFRFNGTPEFAYGLTDWWELGLNLPFAIKDEKFYSNAFKLRTLFVSPHADQRDFFYGVNFEFSNETPPFAQTRFAMEIRPIIGIRNSEYEFIVNPIVDVGFGKYGEQHFAPAARVARKFDQDLYAGFEYYSDFGQIGRFGRFSDQEHTLFAVTDFKLGVIDVNFGVGYGLTPVSDRWVIKTIL